ncbi:hypothetical protein B0T10DRAFT_318156 [Thelonectria olida]|uniref:Uncharacterized protein n=1 Tax=Thelonectria olida TaxID=1576542 RepID=A0A9P9AQF9_9HYPO|nr:hypothetical protein B0T10DRAFT_318156 [Thelonectria olida]
MPSPWAKPLTTDRSEAWLSHQLEILPYRTKTNEKEHASPSLVRGPGLSIRQRQRNTPGMMTRSSLPRLPFNPRWLNRNAPFVGFFIILFLPLGPSVLSSSKTIAGGRSANPRGSGNKAAQQRRRTAANGPSGALRRSLLVHVNPVGASAWLLPFLWEVEMVEFPGTPFPQSVTWSAVFLLPMELGGGRDVILTCADADLH